MILATTVFSFFNWHWLNIVRFTRMNLMPIENESNDCVRARMQFNNKSEIRHSKELPKNSKS